MFNPNDVVINVGGIEVTGFVGGSFIHVQSHKPKMPKLWHTAELLEDGNWKVCVQHKGSRVLTIILTDEKYKNYGIDKLQPTTENPFKIDYNDEDLIMVQK